MMMRVAGERWKWVMRGKETKHMEVCVCVGGGALPWKTKCFLFNLSSSFFVIYPVEKPIMNYFFQVEKRNVKCMCECQYSHNNKGLRKRGGVFEGGTLVPSFFNKSECSG